MVPHACPLVTGFSARVEGRFLIPSKENATSVTALCAAPPVSRDWNSCTKYRWGLIDGALGVRLRPMVVGSGRVTLGFIICFHGKSDHHSRILLCFRRIGFDHKLP